MLTFAHPRSLLTLACVSATITLTGCFRATAADNAIPETLEVICEGLKKPVDFVSDPTHPKRFFILEQPGTIRVVQGGTLLPEPFWKVGGDFTDRGWEQGLLGMALDPMYADNGFFYLNYSAADGATKIVRVTANSPTTTDLDSETLIMRIEQPFANHNGGCIRFGPDGMLYIGMGDGGSANDPMYLSQNPRSLLGKMLRIDVVGARDVDDKAYLIPADNPFVDDDEVLDEIWALGVRNPWKFTFDSLGRMWIADVGQNAREWVHLQPADSGGGENYGWASYEGDQELRLSDRLRRRFGERPAPEEFVLPVFAYDHHPVASITGGYFYEGKAVDALKDRYICADFMSGRMWTFRLGADGKATDVEEVTKKYGTPWKGSQPAVEISSFGRDNEGEIYILDHSAGRLLKIVK